MRDRRLVKSPRRLGDWAFNSFGAPFLAGLIRLLAASLRLTASGREHYEAALGSGRPLIFAFWHEDLFGVAMAFLRLRPERAVAVMVSPSRDGEKLARVIHRLGLETVRASSSRGAVRGLIELKTRMTVNDVAADVLISTQSKPPCPGAAAALALDGPRGPRRFAKPGVALLGRLTGALVVPITFTHSRQKVFNSWDRTRLPLPFARTQIRFAPLIDAAFWQAGEDEAHAARVGEVLNDTGSSFRKGLG